MNRPDATPDRAPTWPSHLPVVQVRFARPTNDLDAAVAFYRDALGLAELYRFADHAGYDGVMLGLPGTGYHLEITQAPGVDGTVRTGEHLLVLYLGTDEAVRQTTQRLTFAGHEPVEAENPYWTDNGAVTFEDPDGWRVVLMAQPGL